MFIQQPAVGIFF